VVQRPFARGANFDNGNRLFFFHLAQQAPGKQQHDQQGCFRSSHGCITPDLHLYYIIDPRVVLRFRQNGQASSGKINESFERMSKQEC
jgi:hypothetical protein